MKRDTREQGAWDTRVDEQGGRRAHCGQRAGRAQNEYRGGVYER
jgi:hypothetical protein